MNKNELNPLDANGRRKFVILYAPGYDDAATTRIQAKGAYVVKSCEQLRTQIRQSCVVLQAAGQALFSRQDLLTYRDAGMGFDGSTWANADSRAPSSWLTRLLQIEDDDEDDESEDALQFEEVHHYRIKPPMESDGEEP